MRRVKLYSLHEMKAALELLRILAEAEDVVICKRNAPLQNTFDDIRASLKEIKTDEV